MIANIVTFLLLLAASFAIAQILASRHGKQYFPVFRNLIFYHIALSLVYYLYALSNPSDSWAYYAKVETNFRGATWFDYYGVSTIFIEFIGYPLIKFFQFPYESVMMVFAWFGLLGFFFFYIFLRENIKANHQLFGFNLLVLVVFLPNLHFWSASFGKGSIIFLGFALYFYGITKVGKRLIALILGALIIYHVRPHVLFVVLVATAIGFMFSTKGVGWLYRFGVVVISVIIFSYIYSDVISLIGFDEDELISGSGDLTRRISDLSKANSGVDITQYNFPMKLFSFIFRPLFIDASGILGVIVSFENLFYLYLFSRIFNSQFISFFTKSNYLVKTAFISFFGVCAALAQISSNLGLAMRQKSQVMILMLFVILKFMDEQKVAQLRAIWLKRRAQARLKEMLSSKAVISSPSVDK
jgi:hypothetical protein